MKAAGGAAAAAALGLLALLASGEIPVFRFVGERIEITVRPRAVEVVGLFDFANRWPMPMTQGMVFPFPDDPSTPAPSAAEILEVDPDTGRALRELPAVWLGGRPRFSLRLPARGRTRLRVRYVQEAQALAASYVLKTTRAWRAPLARGEYVLIPRGVRITRSNYPLAGETPSFARANFMPDQDWKFAWAAL